VPDRRAVTAPGHATHICLAWAGPTAFGRWAGLGWAGVVRLWAKNGPFTIHYFNQFFRSFFNLKFPEIH
jgi:hypothetical protein